MIVPVLMIMLFVVIHQGDKDRCQEHKDERLQEGDKQLEDHDGHAADDADKRHGPLDQDALVPDHADEHEQGRQQDVTGGHVGEQTHGKRHGLDEDLTEELDRNNERPDEHRRIGARR